MDKKREDSVITQRPSKEKGECRPSFFSFWGYPLLSLILWIGVAFLYPSEAWLGAVIGVLIGLLIWTLIEYVIHRFVFHWKPQWPSLRRLVATLHLNHHDAPWDLAIILMRPEHSLFLAVFFFLLFAWLAPTFKMAVGINTGVWAGFLYYELLHYQIHRKRPSRVVLHHQRRDHLYHHFVDNRFCFGVTTPLWDWVFGTHRLEPKKPGKWPDGAAVLHCGL